MHLQLEHSAVALDLERRATGLRTLLLRDLAAALPGRALEHLGERKVGVELFAQPVGDAIPAKSESNARLRIMQ